MLPSAVVPRSAKHVTGPERRPPTAVALGNPPAEDPEHQQRGPDDQAVHERDHPDPGPQRTQQRGNDHQEDAERRVEPPTQRVQVPPERHDPDRGDHRADDSVHRTERLVVAEDRGGDHEPEAEQRTQELGPPLAHDPRHG